MLKVDAIQEKPWYIQAAIFCGIALLLYGGFRYFYSSGIRDETTQLNEQVARLQQDNARAQIASQRLNEFRAAYAQAQSDYADLQALLPEQREITMVLQSLQDRARGRLVLRRFTPKEDVQQEFFSGKPVEVEVSGTYNNLGAFFAQMAAYQRIVSISDFRITQLPATSTSNGQTINAQFLLTAYYVTPERLQSAAPAAPGQTPAAPSAQPPAAR